MTVFAAAGFVLAWSSGFLIAAVGTVEVPATTLLVWRFAPLAVVLVTLVVATGAARGIAPRMLGRQALIGAFAQLGYCAFVYAAIGAGIATGTTALIDAVQPLVIATLVGPLLGLRVRGAQWAGLALGAVGVVLVVRSQAGAADADPVAYLLPAAAMACLVAGTFLERRSHGRPPVLVTLTVHVVVTTVALVVAAIATGTLAPPADPGFWITAAVAALLPTLAAYGLYWWLLERVGITATNALLFLVAPTTAAAGALLLGERITAVTLAGFVLCGAGVAAVLVTEARRAATAPARIEDTAADHPSPGADRREPATRAA
ncbi:drug/metabolite transporter (DMT)-like permease [Clavibacter michiganensis]|uniref:DMT family transporter n=1 Tax=Clavibacter michiganensis TaxID=28447 RepID=UPI0019591483|nr:DMT family transporter [Clavibacter michiganensis]MBM7412497.1 drug/metabolite transporter (DMT)-like permease [Clavibacter michiganensis]